MWRVPAVGLPNYFVSNDGRVWFSSPKRNGELREVSLYRRPYGARYVVVSLRLDGGKGKTVVRYVHRLVLEAFVGPCPPGLECLHADGNTANNVVGNLSWGTRKQNAADKARHGTQARGERAGNAKLTARQVKLIRGALKANKKQSDIAKRFGVSQPSVSNINTGKTWAT